MNDKLEFENTLSTVSSEKISQNPIATWTLFRWSLRVTTYFSSIFKAWRQEARISSGARTLTEMTIE